MYFSGGVRTVGLKTGHRTGTGEMGWREGAGCTGVNY